MRITKDEYASQNPNPEIIGEAAMLIRKHGCLILEKVFAPDFIKANRSTQSRSVLSLDDYRPWFRDYKNFQKHPALLIRRVPYTAIPPIHRHLFS